MDFDIVEDTRPRLQLQQSGGHLREGDDCPSSFSRTSTGICAGLGTLLIGLGLSSVGGPLQFLVIWFGISLLLGPFAPPSVTGGDCRVGVGELVLPDRAEDSTAEQTSGRGHNPHLREKSVFRQSFPEVVNGDVAAGLTLPVKHEPDRKDSTKAVAQRDIGKTALVEQQKDWTLEDIELLKKLTGKHPRGTLRRWEVIAEAFGGKHSADSIVKMSKALGQRKAGAVDQGDYSKFLAQRKGSEVAIASPLSRRENSDSGTDGNENVESAESLDGPSSSSSKEAWTAVEDRALVSALKAFPKDSPMRWEKVALAVPGKSKAQCLRRFSEIRQSVRSSIGTGTSHSRGEPANN